MAEIPPLPEGLERGNVYRHFKGELYELLHAGVCADALTVSLVYRKLHDPAGTVWVRSLKSWSKPLADGSPRFKKTGDEECLCGKCSAAEESFVLGIKVLPLCRSRIVCTAPDQKSEWHLEQLYNGFVVAQGMTVTRSDRTVHQSAATVIVPNGRDPRTLLALIGKLDRVSIYVDNI
jgi:hypothetical protein